MKLIRAKRFGYEGDKRQHIPYIIKWVCPSCGYDNECDFTSITYLSYPNMEGDNQVTMQCSNEDTKPYCYHKIQVCINLSIKAKLVK